MSHATIMRIFLAGLLSSRRFVASSSTLYYPSVSPKPIEKATIADARDGAVQPPCPSYSIPLRARGGADWETPFSASFPRLAPAIDID
jgi:hypothetical protein